ncbi:MAG: type 1 glutamine amidotransferase domain-containing protein [Pseudonocardiaceae bacterium]
MAGTLTGLRVAILAARGVEQVELVQPRQAVTDAGATAELLSVEPGTIQATNHDIELADEFEVDRVVADVSITDYDALILPGGTVNPDTLRRSSVAVAFVRDFVEAAKPVGVICHGPWTLVEADVVRGRTLTSYPSLRTDIRNAGGTVVDEEVVIDGNLVSSRNPHDLPAFCRAIVAHFATAKADVSS